MAGTGRHQTRADRGARAARGARGGAAPARARELRARRAGRGGGRGVGRRRGAGPGARVPGRRRDPGFPARAARSPTSARRPPRRHAAVSRAPRIYVSAGEPSGDAHAAAVVTALKRRLPAATVEAFGGPDLEAAGAVVLDRMERFSVVGFVEALWKLPAHVRLLGRVRDAFRAKRYDLAILVDYPGYHLRAAAAAREAGVPVLYYIAPQMWAWAPGRVRKLAAVRRLAVILPFEERFFLEHGVAATFVGHPLRDRPSPPPRAEAKRALGLDPMRPVLGLFPGSRAQEVKRLWPAFRDAALRVGAARPDAEVVVAGTPHGEYPAPAGIRLHTGDPLGAFAAADARLGKSGTTTLAAARADVPVVSASRLNPDSAGIGSRLREGAHVGLGNLIAGRDGRPAIGRRAVS